MYKRLALLVFTAILLPWHICIAQEAAPETSSTEAESQAEYSLSETVERLETDNASLLELQQAADSEKVKRWKKSLEQLSSQIASTAEIAADVFSAGLKSLTINDLSTVETPVSKISSKFELLREELKAEIEKLGSTRDSIVTKKNYWKSALEQKKDKALSKGVADSAEALIGRLENAQKNIEEQIESIVALQQEAGQRATPLTQLEASLESALTTVRTSLLYRTSPNVVESGYWSELFNFKNSGLGSNVFKRYIQLKDYLADQKNRALIHLVLFLLIYWAFFRFQKSELAKDSFPKLYDNPGILAFTSTLLCSLLIYPEPPQIFYTALGISLVIPLVLFFHDFFDRQYTSSIVGVATLYLMDRIRDLIPDFSALGQAILLVELLLAAYLCERLARACDNTLEGEQEEGSSNKSKIKFLVATLSQGGRVVFVLCALAVTVGFIRIGLFVGQSLFTAIYNALLTFAVYRLSSGFFHSLLTLKPIRHIRYFTKNREVFSERINQLLAVVFLFVWISQTVKAFGFSSLGSKYISGLLDYGVKLGDISISTESILVAVVVMVLGLTISRISRGVLNEDVYTRYSLDAGVRYTINTVLHYAILLIALMMALSALGVGFQNVALIAGALSVGIGFGLQTIVNNFVSGIILLAERPIKVGDLILVGDTLGTVSRIGIRSSTIRTLDEAEIIIPNATLVSENVINWTLSSPRARITVAVGVAYGTDVHKCIEVLKEAITSLDFILEYPPPDILFTDFGDSSLNFKVRGWIRDVKKRPKHESELTLAIHDALYANGIEIPFPQRDVHIKQPQSA